jgi:Peroxidase, family 2
MKLSTISTSLAFAFAHAQGSIEGWTPAGPNDRNSSTTQLTFEHWADVLSPRPMPHDEHPCKSRLPPSRWWKHHQRKCSPCPLHSHKFQHLPRITNVGPSHHFKPRTECYVLHFVCSPLASPSSPSPQTSNSNTTITHRDNLNRHNVLEHDASMSRSDAFFGNNHIFNSTIFATTTTFWTSDTLTPGMLANGKIARQLASKAFNPNYTFTSTTEAFSLGEVAAPIIVFGDLPSATVNRSLVEFFFGKRERYFDKEREEG